LSSRVPPVRHLSSPLLLWEAAAWATQQSPQSIHPNPVWHALPLMARGGMPCCRAAGECAACCTAERAACFFQAHAGLQQLRGAGKCRCSADAAACCNQQSMCRCAADVQDDALLAQMTVAETLALHAALHMGATQPREVLMARQASVLAAMGLAKQRHTLVSVLHPHGHAVPAQPTWYCYAWPAQVGGALPGGIVLRGLSGGERKRLAIGTGLLPAPRLLFADEPTSGTVASSAKPDALLNRLKQCCSLWQHSCLLLEQRVQAPCGHC
jgi:hypothetical protein